MKTQNVTDFSDIFDFAKEKFGIGWHPKSPSCYLYNGIDRKNNFLGYTLENIVPCCEKCNRAKHIMNLTEFKKWVYSVYENFIGSNRQNSV